MKYENVMERVYEPGRLLEAWQQVRSNAGAAGVDGMTVENFEKRIKELFPIVRNKLIDGTYRFKPVKRVEIDKEGSKKKRKLGIPVVIDRIIGTAIAKELEDIFDNDFTESNFGYRPGRSQHMAITHVKAIKKNDSKFWCASIDLKSFFDEIPHNLILKLLRRKIADERLMTLIARALKAGVVIEGRFEKTQKGCPQGSPLSPLLSNIVLNEVDQELERRGLQYARWADDCIILLKSKRAADRVMKSMIHFLEDELGLPVNMEKSTVAKLREIPFLGFKIDRNLIQISEKKDKIFKKRVKELTKRNNPHSMEKIIQELNTYLQGWGNYFNSIDKKSTFPKYDRWIRNRLRSMQLKKWKKPRRFQKEMKKEGSPPKEAEKTWVKMRNWRSIHRKEVRKTLSNNWFERQGLIFLADLHPKPNKCKA